MIPDSIPAVLLPAVAAWGLLHAPGRLLLGRGGQAVPDLFAHLLLSSVVTTLTATGLAAAGRFSLGAVLAANLAVVLVGTVLRRLAGPTEPAQQPLGSGGAPPSERDRLGPLLVAAALLAYWPAWPTFLAASDSTAYVTTGVSLAHHGHLWRDDQLGRALPPPAQAALFDSMSQVLGHAGPPYRRMPGAMMLEALGDERAWPDFFPVPSVWSALFVEAGATGWAEPERAAPNYAPLFASLALWAFWLVARNWLGTGLGLVAVALLGASSPYYNAARMALSEPIAAWFTLGALAVLVGAISRSNRVDPRAALLAGAALAGAMFTRVETALWLAMAFALLPTLTGARRLPLPRPFFAALAAGAACTVAEALSLPGTWTDPLHDHLTNASLQLVLQYGLPGLVPAILATALAAAAFVAAGRRFGWSAALRWSFLAAVLVGHAGAARFLVERTPMWLSFSIGWSGLALAGVGGALAWRERDRLGGAPFVLAAFAAVALLLFYNPHVYPVVPWGARRFVPLLLPVLVLLACHAAGAAAARSRMLGLACVALLAYPVWLGGRPTWGHDFVDGAWEALAAIDAAVPEGGIVLYDREISALMVGPSMWLVHDREGLAVPPTSSAPGRQWVAALTWNFARSGPVWFVTKAAGQQWRPPKVAMTPVAQVPVTLPFLEQTYDRRPERRENFAMPIAVYRLQPGLNPRPILID